MNALFTYYVETNARINETCFLSIKLIRHSGILLQHIDSYKATLESLVGCNNDDMARVYTQLSNAEDILRRQIIN